MIGGEWRQYGAIVAVFPLYQTGMMARVRELTFRSASSQSIHKVSSSISARTTLPPLCNTESPVAANVSAGMITSLPRTPRASQVIWRALVQLLTAIACLTPMRPANCSSSSSVTGPLLHQPLRRILVTFLISRSEQLGLKRGIIVLLPG